MRVIGRVHCKKRIPDYDSRIMLEQYEAGRAAFPGPEALHIIPVGVPYSQDDANRLTTSRLIVRDRCVGTTFSKWIRG